MNRVGPGRSASNHETARAVRELRDAPIGGTQVVDEYALMKLAAPFEHGRDECDTETASPVRQRLVRLEPLFFLFFGKEEYASCVSGTNRPELTGHALYPIPTGNQRPAVVDIRDLAEAATI
jgi:hypothetical protein